MAEDRTYKIIQIERESHLLLEDGSRITGDDLNRLPLGYIPKLEPPWQERLQDEVNALIAFTNWTPIGGITLDEKYAYQVLIDAEVKDVQIG